MLPTLPQTDPRASYLAHKSEIEQAISRVLEAGQYILGPEVDVFEHEFAAYLGAEQAIGVANGTEALYLALCACGIGRGDAVITVSHTAIATVAAIDLTGAMPVLVDIDPATYTMDPGRLEDTVRQQRALPASAGRLKAVIPVHLYGQMADMPAIRDVAERYGLTVLEDCAQCHGAALSGRKAGKWGHIAAFSFYPTKNLGALGDGGAIVTDDSKLAEKVRLLREYGWRERYVSHIAGLNSRLDPLQAAVLRVKLRYLERENARRREIARLYDEGLVATPLRTPHVRAGSEHVYHQYVVRAERREDLRTFLRGRGIGTLVHYPMPAHLQPAYRGRVVIGAGGLEASEQVCEEVLSLPMYAQMADDQARMVCQAIGQWPAAEPRTL